jgi:hypothetical protein
VAEWLPWLQREHTRRQTWMFPWETTLSDVHRTRRFEPCRSRTMFQSFMVAFCRLAIYIMGMSDTVIEYRTSITSCSTVHGVRSMWRKGKQIIAIIHLRLIFPRRLMVVFAKQLWKWFENTTTYAYVCRLFSQFPSQSVGVRSNTGERKCWIPFSFFWCS